MSPGSEAANEQEPDYGDSDSGGHRGGGGVAAATAADNGDDDDDDEYYYDDDASDTEYFPSLALRWGCAHARVRAVG